MKKKIYIIPYGIAILALLFAAFYDYEITNTLHNSMPLIQVLFERIVLIPIQLVVAITLCMLFQIKRRNGYCVAAYIAILYVVRDTLHYWVDTSTTYLILVQLIVSFLLLILILWIMQKINPITLKTHLTFFVYMSIVLVVSIIITTIMKHVWGRIRYRDLQEVTQFCAWYKPCGLSGNYSFPSGHTTAMSAILCILQWRRNPYAHISIWRNILVFGMIVIMMIARMAAGAHFLSDVSVGFLITYSCYLGITKWFKRRNYL